MNKETKKILEEILTIANNGTFYQGSADIRYDFQTIVYKVQEILNK